MEREQHGDIIPYFALGASDVESLLTDYWNTPNYNTPNYNTPNYNTPNYNTYNNYLQTDVLGSRTAAGGHESGAIIKRPNAFHI